MADDDQIDQRRNTEMPSDRGPHDCDRWHFLAPDGEGATPAYAERFHLVYSVMVPAAWRYEVAHRFKPYGRVQRQRIAAASDLALHLTFGPPPVIALSPSSVVDRVRVPTTTSINWLIEVARSRAERAGRHDGPSRPRRTDGLENYPGLARQFDQACLRLSGSYAGDVRAGDIELLQALRALGSSAADRLEQAMRQWRWQPSEHDDDRW